MSQPPKIFAVALRQLAQEIEDEADNLSPTTNVHPTGAMRKWARRIERIARGIAPVAAGERT